MSSALSWLRNAWPKTEAHEALGTAYKGFADTPQGKLIIEDLARYCNLRNASFSSGDPHTTSFNEGQRDVLLHILEMGGLDALELTKTQITGTN